MEDEVVLGLIEIAARKKRPFLNLNLRNLTSLSSKIGECRYLTTLQLTGNQLISLPSEIGKLNNLTTLQLTGNQLISLPKEIGNLTNLTTLYLSKNKLASLPSEIGNLTNLKELYLFENELTNLPPDIGNLKNLTTLYLSSNKLTSLPLEIGKLAKLTTFHLSENKLTYLPQGIVKLKNLIELDLDNNPLKAPPPEIAKQGIKAIFEYLNQLQEEAIEHNEAKLIIVGQGEVGKTCLAKRLMFATFTKEKTTEGIDIYKWEIKAPTEEHEEINLNVWDFGGQEIYHATHQFFLTKRSVYLLVWNARKSHDYERIDYWLHTIEAFGENSPIILVLSKLNERDDNLNMKDLKEKFPQIVDLYKVDSEDGKGIPDLKKIISKTAWNLPHMQIPWIKSWFKIRERIEQDGRDWIEDSEFHKICETEGLDKAKIDSLDEFLHDLGVIIHFRDRIGLKNMVILKPGWATKAFYKILDTRSIRERGGILWHDELEQVWDTNNYPSNIYPKLLELMNKFELAFDLPDNKSHLVAELLPSTEPEFEWDDANNLNFFYRYDFLPAGVMTRFIVLVHHELENRSDGTHLCWREGAVLRREGTRAFVKVKPFDRLIDIRIYGDNKRELLAIIREKFDHINGSIKKVKITEEIPCNCSKDCPTKFEYKDLLNAEKAGLTNIDCLKNSKRVRLSSLLEGYESKENRMKKITKENYYVIKDSTIFSASGDQSRINFDTNDYSVNISGDLTTDLDSLRILIEKDYKGEGKSELIDTVHQMKQSCNDPSKKNWLRKKLGWIVSRTSEVASISSLAITLLQGLK